MNSLNLAPTVIFEASIKVNQKTKLGAAHGIGKGFSFSLLFDKICFPSQIAIIETEILPGETGLATIYMLKPPEFGNDFGKNSEFLIMNGPKEIGSGRVITTPEILE